MVRRDCCEKIELKKGRWTTEEDEILVNYINANGEGSWRSVAKNAGLLRCGKSCRLRWINYLKPGIKRGNFTTAEETTIVKLHTYMGNKWSEIAAQLPGRTDNELKNYWNSHLKRKMYCFTHVYQEMTTNNAITMANNNRNGAKVVQTPATRKKCRLSVPSKTETTHAPCSITLADHISPEKNNSMLLLQKNENRDAISEHGSSSNMSAESAFPNFHIKSLVQDMDYSLEKISPQGDTWPKSDLVSQDYLDLEPILQVDGDDVWCWQYW